MLVYRLVRKKYGIQLSGVGAARSGNRWNSRGTEIIYTSGSRALAMAEVAVHLSIAMIPNDYVMLEIHIDDNTHILSIDATELDLNWNSHPPIKSTQLIGDQFIANHQYGVMKVPSAVVSGDYNYLINPRHADIKKVYVRGQQDFKFDRRLFK